MAFSVTSRFIIRAQNLSVKFLKLLNGKLSKKVRRAESI